MFEDSRINIFMAVAEEGSFTKAARQLGISQPAVSQNIAEIEKAIGTYLFDRTRTAVTLTADGVKFREYAEQILYWYRAASEAFRDGLPESLRKGIKEKKDLRIGISDDYRCFLVPAGSEDVDIDVQAEGRGMSVRVIQKVAEPESPATLFF